MDIDPKIDHQSQYIKKRTDQLNLTDLPSLVALDWQVAEFRYRYVSIAAKCLPIVIFALIMGLSIFLENKLTDSLIYLLPPLLIGLGLAAIYGFAFAKSCRYVITNRLILIHSGVFWQKTTAVPINRIQHVDLSQGPLERTLGLASCKFYTAGGGIADPRIRGLLFANAKKIRQYVLARLEAAKDEF